MTIDQLEGMCHMHACGSGHNALNPPLFPHPPQKKKQQVAEQTSESEKASQQTSKRQSNHTRFCSESVRRAMCKQTHGSCHGDSSGCQSDVPAGSLAAD